MTDELDPKQIEFLKNYLDPESDTFSNTYQSGLKAGFSETYSKNLLSLMPEWLSTFIEDNQLVSKAMKNLNDLLGSEDERVKADLTKFALERLNKKKFSAKSEVDVTSKGKPIETINYIVPDGNNIKADT